MFRVASDIELEINHWYPGKAVTALRKFNYHLGGIVVRRTRYIVAYKGLEIP
jgi:hypothetical protein